MKKLESKKSLRTILVFVLLGFSLAPLGFLTGYSLVKYEQSIDQELTQRLSANSREVITLLSDFENALVTDGQSLAADKRLAYDLSTNRLGPAAEKLSGWLRGRVAHRLWVWSAEGRLEIALYRDELGEVRRMDAMETGEVFLSDLSPLKGGDQTLDVDLRTDGRRTGGGAVELMVFTHLKTQSGRTIGFAQQVLEMDQNFLNSLRRRLGVELAFSRSSQAQIVSTHKDLSLYKPDFFVSQIGQLGGFDLSMRQEPYRFVARELAWGQTPLVVSLGVSKTAARQVLKKINETFFTVVIAVGIFLILMVIITSRILLKPIQQLVTAIQSHDPGKELVTVPTDNETELGLLAESFNDMARRTYESQRALRDKINELETANVEVRETQARLVHAAKMSSLGQLVAGIAHELNNPIGFIYSNLGVLRSYTQKLSSLIDAAPRGDATWNEMKAHLDYDYIKEDLSRLISSCEDGARRTRDIVLGLRNFSRLDEAQLKEVDLHEGLDNTLSLLSGELKNRIEVVKNYGQLPKVLCYASQMNQVFMNILANASQAMQDKGILTLTTSMTEDGRVSIRIRDTGRGMDQSTLERIFDPFFTTKGQGSGTGLGLSISYGIVQRHGGEILVDSTPGQGTEFHIIIPVRIAGA